MYEGAVYDRGPIRNSNLAGPEKIRVFRVGIIGKKVRGRK